MRIRSLVTCSCWTSLAVDRVECGEARGRSLRTLTGVPSAISAFIPTCSIASDTSIGSPPATAPTISALGEVFFGRVEQLVLGGLGEGVHRDGGGAA